MRNLNSNVSLVPPRFNKPLDEQHTCSLTKSIVLVAQTTARPAPKFKFIKDNRELLIKDRFKSESMSISENVTEIKLIIEGVQASDAGVYKIEASNKCANATTHTEVVVKGEPVFVRKPADMSVPEKRHVKFDCEVIGLPQPTLEWFKDGVLIEKSDNIQIDSRKTLNTLSIKELGVEHTGRYVMKAKNESGEAECSVILNVDGK